MGELRASAPVGLFGSLCI